MSAATLHWIPGHAGRLCVHDWPRPESARALVLIVHGLGEHAGRYENVAQRLLALGCAVRAYDHPGHGQSDGARGTLQARDGLLQDLAQVLDHTRAQSWARGLPLVLLGHSMGGLVAARAVADGLRPIDGLILSSPALGTWATPFQKFLVQVLPGLVPRLCVANGLDPRAIARDPAVVAAYQADPLVHDRISARLGEWIQNEGPRTVAQAGQWRVPTLLLYAGADRLVRPEASRDFARAAPALVQSACFEPMFHEIFNDPERDQVWVRIGAWLNAPAVFSAAATTSPEPVR